MNFGLFQKHARGHPTLLGENSSYDFFFFHLNIDRLLMNNSKSPIPIWLTCAKPLVCHACLPTTAPAVVQSCELHQILPSIIPGRPVTETHLWHWQKATLLLKPPHFSQPWKKRA